jgi:hypothetical protein
MQFLEAKSEVYREKDFTSLITSRGLKRCRCTQNVKTFGLLL